VAGVRLKAEQSWHKSVLLWLVVPPSMALVLSLAFGPSYVDRYLSVCLPGYLVLVAGGLTRLSGPNLRVALGVALLIAMTVSTFGILSGQRLQKADWREAVAHVRGGARDGDRLLVDARALYVTFYYVGQTLPIERVELQTTEEALDHASQQKGRIWFLYRDPLESVHVFDRVRRFDPYASGEPHITRWLEEHQGQIKREWCLRGVYLALLE
jgi:hypothetical protein